VAAVKGRIAFLVTSLVPALALGVAALPSGKGIVIVECEIVAIIGGVRWEVRALPLSLAARSRRTRRA
jgi:hypothetical protein